MNTTHAELQRLSGLLHDVGCVPYIKLVLHNVEKGEKVSHLFHHSEKLAIALGLINTAPGTPLRIRKNLWVCEDCHTYTKFISKIVGRAIMVRDANCFQGVCSFLHGLLVMPVSLSLVHFVCSMSSDIVTRAKFNSVPIYGPMALWPSHKVEPEYGDILPTKDALTKTPSFTFVR
jgi:hypothetical protein